MITYSRNDLLHLSHKSSLINPLDQYKFNLFYYNIELGMDTLINVVNTVNSLSPEEKTKFVDIYSYLGIDHVYNEYKRLIYLGLDMNIQNEWGFTILHYAYLFKDAEFIKYLLLNGANPNSVISKGPYSGKKPSDL